MYLYGKNSVLERLRANPKSIKRIYLEKGFDTPQIVDTAKSARIPLERVTERELARIKHADRLQGIVALAEDFKYASFDEFLQEAPNKDISLIVLDGINDPHNLGSIIRSAACFGNFCVIIPRHSSCEVNDTVVHVASGGENFVPVCMVNNVTTAVIKAKNAGYWAVGAVVEEGDDVTESALPFPICIVLGSEGKGIRQSVKKKLDMKVSLPMEGASLSFNVAMACAIFCHEITRQKKTKKGV